MITDWDEEEASVILISYSQLAEPLVVDAFNGGFPPTNFVSCATSIEHVTPSSTVF